MATFIRRGLTKLVESRQAPKPAGLTLSRPEGGVTFSAREAPRYGLLMTMLDTDGDDQVSGLEGASFLRRSGLDVGECSAGARAQARARESAMRRLRLAGGGGGNRQRPPLLFL